jgi:hypothetical protein
MTDDRMLFQSCRFVVTDAFLRTSRRTYKLQDIAYVQVKRPLLLLTASISMSLQGWR